MTSVKWNGKEVQSPFRRKLVVAVVLISVPIMFVISMAFFIFVAVPLILLLHLPLRLLGRNGTMRSTPGNLEWKLDRKAFQKRLLQDDILNHIRRLHR